jgi:hypothetical protein
MSMESRICSTCSTESTPGRRSSPRGVVIAPAGLSGRSSSRMQNWKNERAPRALLRSSADPRVFRRLPTDQEVDQLRRREALQRETVGAGVRVGDTALTHIGVHGLPGKAEFDLEIVSEPVKQRRRQCHPRPLNIVYSRRAAAAGSPVSPSAPPFPPDPQRDPPGGSAG